ncbi:hypothetical protein SAMN04488574_105135 [Bacillus sp. 71mf]|nr:hypothetical protein SAMN04488574_105135 [Bacillus sp. 71mf]SFS65443.1 hypothetical protein SAMN04488145_102183 [Bacillus sp. 103mf]
MEKNNIHKKLNLQKKGHFFSYCSYNLPIEKKLVKGKKGVEVKKRVHEKIILYAYILRKLRIINEQEKNAMLQIMINKRAL